MLDKNRLFKGLFKGSLSLGLVQLYVVYYLMIVLISVCVQLLLGVVHENVLAVERVKQEVDLIYTDFFHVPETTQGTAKGMLSSSHTCFILKDFTVL